MLLAVSSTLRKAGGPGAGGQFQEASVVWHTGPALCGPLCGDTIVPCTVEGARLGPNVPSATAVYSAAASIFFYLSIPSQCTEQQQNCTTKLPRLVSLASLKVPVSPTFLQRHCCCLSQGVKGPYVHLFYQHSGTKLQIGCGWDWSPIISYIFIR